MTDKQRRLLELEKEVNALFEKDGSSTFGIGRVVGRNDYSNLGMVRILPIEFVAYDYTYLEFKYIDFIPFAQVLSPAKGEGHGFYYTPEFGDFVIYTRIYGGFYVIGSISTPSQMYTLIYPHETMNNQMNGLEYCHTHYPNLTAKGYHLPGSQNSDSYHPASFLLRWRKNDILMYNATQLNKGPGSALKLMEFRTSENLLIQLVDIGNRSIAPGTMGINKSYTTYVRQTDFRDLWEGFNVNREFWTERTDRPPLTNESQYIRIATNGANISEFSPAGDTGAPYPSKTKGETRWDDRLTFGSLELSKIYAPVYQAVKSSIGPERYVQDKIPNSPFGPSVVLRMKVQYWIEDLGNPYDPEVQHFNIGHYIVLSNTQYKRRLMLSTKKGHQFVMSDIDKDEKVLLNSMRGKYVYMEDSDPGHYNVMWLASEMHHIVFVDNMMPPYLLDDKGNERHRICDPNWKDLSSFLLFKTNAGHRMWFADTQKYPRVHIKTTDGHEMLFIDAHEFDHSNRKIQITTAHGKMQIVMDEKSKKIEIINVDDGGIKVSSKGNIEFHTQGMMIMNADKGFDVNSSDGNWYETTNTNDTNSDAPRDPASLSPVKPSVPHVEDTTDGEIINRFDPS